MRSLEEGDEIMQWGPTIGARIEKKGRRKESSTEEEKGQRKQGLGEDS